MTLILPVAALLALSAICASLIRAIATDGYGSGAAPRSHPEELGSWISQQLAR